MLNIICHQGNVNQTHNELPLHIHQNSYHKKGTQLTDVSKNVEKLDSSYIHCWWEEKKVLPLWETVWHFLKILSIELPYDLAIPLLGIYPKETHVHTKTCVQMFIIPLFIVAKRGKHHKCAPTNEWIHKMLYIHTVEYYLAIKRHKIHIYATTWTNLKNITLSQRSQHRRPHFI